MKSENWREEVAERLADHLGRAGKTQRDLAMALGISEPAVSQWLRRGVPEAWAQVHGVCRALNVPADWLLGTRPTAEPVPLELQTPIGPEGYVTLPSMEDKLAAGNALVQTDRFSDTYYAFRQQWLDSKRMRKRKLVTARVARTHHGESMKETIQPGALLLIDLTPVTQESFKQRGIYVVRAVGDEGGVTVKRVVQQPGYVVCMSDNEVFNPFSLEIDGELSKVLVGRVVWWATKPHRRSGREVRVAGDLSRL